MEKERGQVDKPGSVKGPSSIWRADVAVRLLQSTRGQLESELLMYPLLDFAPDEACRTPCVTAKRVVGSYPAFSPFLMHGLPGISGMFSVALSVDAHLPIGRLTPPGNYPASCSAEPGLSSGGCRAQRAHPLACSDDQTYP